jgi:hypothetical protein
MRTRTFRDAGRACVWLALASSVVWAAACSSSSGGAKSEPDSGTNIISPLSDAAAGGLNLTCGQLAGIGGGTATPCAVGQTCCTTFSITSLSASSVCTAKDACNGISNECMTSTDCATGQVCCTGAPPSDAGGDAATGGPSLGGFSLGGFATTCQASCASGQTQQCSTDSECPTGEICQSLGAAFTGDGGFGDAGFGDAGFGAFGDAGFDASFFGDGGIVLPKYCVAPPTDAGSKPDSSEPVVDSAAPAVDAGADAGPDGSPPPQ